MSNRKKIFMGTAIALASLSLFWGSAFASSTTTTGKAKGVGAAVGKCAAACATGASCGCGTSGGCGQCGSGR